MGSLLLMISAGGIALSATMAMSSVVAPALQLVENTRSTSPPASWARVAVGYRAPAAV
jgi:hypothetical protein